MKRRTRYKSVKSHRSYHKKTPIYFSRYVIISLGIVILLVMIKTATTSNPQKGNYLGASSFIVKEGSDSGTSGGSSGSGDSSGTKSSGESSSGSSSSGSNSSTSNTGSSQTTKSENENRITPVTTQITVIPTRVERKESEQKKEENNKQTKVKFEFEEGKLIIKNESSQEAEIKVSKKVENEVETELENEGIELKEATGGGTIVKHGNAEAETKFPLSLDLATHALVVTTPVGTRQVTVLPDAAISNLLEKGLVDEANPNINLEDQNGQAVFKVDGIKRKKLLGLIPVLFRKNITVSAQNLDVLGQNEALIDRLLEIFSL